MGHPVKRIKVKHRTPTFNFSTKGLDGIPPKDTPKERANKDKMIANYIKKHGVTRG